MTTMRLRELAMLVGIAALGFALGKAFVAAREVNLAHSSTSVAIIPTKPLLTDSLKRSAPARGIQERSETATRNAYHLPDAELEASVALYAENGWWEGIVILFRRWARLNPEAALEKALAIEWSLPAPEKRYGDHTMEYLGESWGRDVLGEISEAWFAQNPDEAMQAFLKASQDKNAMVSLTSAIKRYAEHDPAAAHRLLREQDRDFAGGELEIYNHSHGGSGHDDARTLFTNWASRDPAAAIEEALAYEDRSIRGGALAGVYKGWAEVDPKAAQAWLEALDADLANSKWIQEERAKVLAKEDPLRALQLEGLSYQRKREIIQDLVKRDGTAALQLVGDVVQPEARRSLSFLGTEILAGQTLGSELGAAVLQLPSDLQTEALRMLASHWKQDEPEAARAFAESIPDAVLRRYYLHHVDSP